MSTDLRSQAHPAGWHNAVLGDVADVNPESLGVGTPPDTRFRYIDLSAVERGHVRWSDVREEVFRTSPSRARRVVAPGDVLFGTVRPALQSHGYVEDQGVTRLVASTGFAVVRARPTFSHPRFLFHTMLGFELLKQTRRVEVGSNYPAVNESDVRQFPLCCPPVAEQRRIAEILDTLDEAIRATELVIAKLQQVKQGLLHDLLTRGIDEHGVLRDPERHPEHFMDSPLGKIPNGWRVVSLRDVSLGGGAYGSGASARPFDPNMPRYVRITDMMDDGRLDPNSRASITPRAAAHYMLSTGDLLFARSGATVGKTYLYRDEDGVCAHAGYVIRFAIDPSMAVAAYIFHWTKGAYYWRWVQRTLRQGAQPNINANEYGNHLLALPPLHEQAGAVSMLDEFNNRLWNEQKQAEKLRALKHGLMEDLLVGRIRVLVPEEVSP